MRIVLNIAFGAALLNLSAFAADQPKKKTAAIPTKIEQTASASTKQWVAESYTDSANNLPEKYNGIDAKKFLELFRDKIKVLKKDEYETTEAYQRRIANKAAVLNPISISDSYAFRIQKFSVKYDADTKTYNLGDESYACHEMDQISKTNGSIICTVAPMRVEADTYQGTNAYGVSKTIQRLRIDNFALAIPKNSGLVETTYKQDPKSPKRYSLKVRINVPLDKARTLKDQTIAVVLVGRVIDAKITEEMDSETTPTLDMPIDILITQQVIPFELKKVIFYVYETGEILDQKSL